MITKSEFLDYLDSQAHFSAEVHGLIPPKIPDQMALMNMESGKEVERLAHEYLIQFVLPRYSQSHNGNELFRWQPSESNGDLMARTDALIFDALTHEYHLFEVKSGTKAKEEFLQDITFQSLVFGDHNTGKYFLVYLNKDYVRRGELNLSQLFVVQEVTEEVLEKQEEIADLARHALWIKDQAEPPEVEGCMKPRKCPCPDYCHPGKPIEYSMYDLPRINLKRVEELESEILAMDEDAELSIFNIPENARLTYGQELMVRSAKNDAPVINYEAIEQMRASCKGPKYYLDYESINYAIPQFDGFSPQQQMVFQCSLHVVSHDGAEPIHYEFLATGKGDPTEELLAFLQEHMPEPGTVVVWNKNFESLRNKEMASRHPEFADFLSQINENMFDLMEVFSKNYYVDYRFHGSASIKNVLPVLVPELSYAALKIQNGEEAMSKWNLMINGDLDEVKKEAIRRNLLRYCELDTWAMIAIWDKLMEAIAVVS